MDNIEKIKKAFVDGNFNSCRIDINHLDNIFYFKGSPLQFLHYTGCDSEEYKEKDFNSNTYIKNEINNNIDKIIRLINFSSERRMENSIKQFDIS